MVERVDMHRTAFLRYMPTGTRVDKAELFGGAGTTVAFTLPDGREGEHTITPELYVMRGLDVVGPAVRQFMRDAGLPIQVPRR